MPSRDSLIATFFVLSFMAAAAISWAGFAVWKARKREACLDIQASKTCTIRIASEVGTLLAELEPRDPHINICRPRREVLTLEVHTHDGKHSEKLQTLGEDISAKVDEVCKQLHSSMENSFDARLQNLGAQLGVPTPSSPRKGPDARPSLEDTTPLVKDTTPHDRTSASLPKDTTLPASGVSARSRKRRVTSSPPELQSPKGSRPTIPLEIEIEIDGETPADKENLSYKIAITQRGKKLIKKNVIQRSEILTEKATRRFELPSGVYDIWLRDLSFERKKTRGPGILRQKVAVKMEDEKKVIKIVATPRARLVVGAGLPPGTCHLEDAFFRKDALQKRPYTGYISPGDQFYVPLHGATLHCDDDEVGRYWPIRSKQDVTLCVGADGDTKQTRDC